MMADTTDGVNGKVGREPWKEKKINLILLDIDDKNFPTSYNKCLL